MADLAFAQPARRSYWVPAGLALVFAAALAATFTHFFPTTDPHPQITLLRLDLLPTHTVFKSESIVVGPEQALDALYLVAQVQIDNKTGIPVTLDDFTLSSIAAGGGHMDDRAFEKQDLPNLLTTFPALKPLVSAPLLRDTTLAPGQSAHGMILFQLPETRAAWDARRSASLQVALFRQPSLTLSLKGTPAP